MAVGDGADSGDIDVGDVVFQRSRGAPEKIVPILAKGFGADILARRDDVEYEQGFVRKVGAHDRIEVSCLNGRGQFILKPTDSGDVVGGGARIGDRAEADDCQT